MISLERRLQLGLVLSMAGFTLLFLLLGGYTVHRLSEGYVLSRLEHDAESLLGAAHRDGQGRDAVAANRITPVYLQPLSGHYYALKTGDQPPQLSRSLWDSDLPVPALQPGQRRVQKVAGPSEQKLLQLSIGYRKHGHPLVVSVAEDVAPLERQILNYQWGFGLGALVLLGLLMLMQRRLVQQSFMPLEKVREQVRQVVNGEQERLDDSVPSEVYPLVSEINRLLALLETRLTRSRHALGNLAHALNTPLNLIAQELDDGELPEALYRRLTGRMERIHQLIERELRLARLAGSGTPGRHFDPAVEIPGLIQVLQGMYRGKDLDFHVSVLPAPALALDREDMLELLGNLLDNACKWSRGRVALDMGIEDGVRLQVEDDGPGVAEGDLPRLARRGARIDEQSPGHGLGLAIVQDIVVLYNGSLDFSRSERLGGLCVRVHLPIDRAPAQATA
jgi:signal transduction histidine kinase